MPNEYEARWRHAGHYLLVLQKADKRFRNGADDIREGLELFDTEWLNIRAAIEWCVGQSPASDAGAFFVTATRKAGPIYYTCAHTPPNIFGGVRQP
jgi:hypothetical protein